MAFTNIGQAVRKKQLPCKKRTYKSCKTARKRCKWAQGESRAFCRKSKTRRHRKR